jgi:hypothetical protein
MKARVNTYALRQTTVESAGLGVLGNIAHPMSDDGEYAATVVQGKKEVATFRLKVDSKIPNPQTDVDLALLVPRLREQARRYEEATFEIASKGYLVLYVSQGPGGFHVLLEKLGADPTKKERRVFDSRSLQKEDLFIVTLLRPGVYEMCDQFGKAKGQIKVEYPKAGKGPYAPPEPARVNVTADAFQPGELTLGAAQSIVFSVATEKSSLAVSLTQPDDGPRKKEETPGRVRWTNPTSESPGGAAS